MGPGDADRQLEAEAALARWRARAGERDDIVRAAHDAGVTINRISKLTGLSRTTIYRILGLETQRDETDT